MWLGEQITERGIGNGMSLIIFVGIVVGLPRAIINLYELRPVTAAVGRRSRRWSLILLLALMIAVVASSFSWKAASAAFRCSTRSASSAARSWAGRSTYLPLRVNSGGVIPPIFASSLLTFPGDHRSGFRHALHFPAHHCRPPEVGRAAVHLDLHHADPGVCVFLRGHRVQSHRACRQHAQVWRLHSRAFARDAPLPSTSAAF